MSTSESKLVADQCANTLISEDVSKVESVPSMEVNADSISREEIREVDRTGSNDEVKIDEKPVQASQSELPLKRTTGPRTPSGKRRSKMNASKHGIFTAGILDGEERKADHDKLVEELRDHFQPQGTYEELLVEKLAMLYGRHRRLLIAEKAEILKERGDRKLEREALEQEDRINSKKSERGLMDFLDNPFVVKRCIKLHTDWRELVRQRGYDAYWDYGLMRKLYGRLRAEELDAHTQKDLKEIFESSAPPHDVRSDQEKQEAHEKGCQHLVGVMDRNIELLGFIKRVTDSIDAELTQYEGASKLVPRAECLDRLIRYEAHIDRAFDRTLNQLERSIRMRLGHPVPPSINIEIGQ